MNEPKLVGRESLYALIRAADEVERVMGKKTPDEEYPCVTALRKAARTAKQELGPGRETPPAPLPLSVSGLIGRRGKVVGYSLSGDRVSDDNEAVAHICLDLDNGPRVFLQAEDPDAKWEIKEEPR